MYLTSLLGEEAIRLWPRIVSEQKIYREKVVWWKYTMRHGECIYAIKKVVILNTSGSIFLPKKTQKTLPVENFYEISTTGDFFNFNLSYAANTLHI